MTVLAAPETPSEPHHPEMSSAAGGQTRRVLQAWRTPIYVADLPGAHEINATLLPLVLDAEKRDPGAEVFLGGTEVIRANRNILRWDGAEITWLLGHIRTAADALMADVLGDAARQVTQQIVAEGWSAVYRGGGNLRTHTHHDSPWSGVYYVDGGSGAGPSGAGQLMVLDPRPAAVARQASPGPILVEAVPGRLIAFPGWLPHAVRATLLGGRMRVALAFNVGYRDAAVDGAATAPR